MPIGIFTLQNFPSCNLNRGRRSHVVPSRTTSALSEPSCIPYHHHTTPPLPRADTSSRLLSSKSHAHKTLPGGGRGRDPASSTSPRHQPIHHARGPPGPPGPPPGRPPMGLGPGNNGQPGSPGPPPGAQPGRGIPSFGGPRPMMMGGGGGGGRGPPPPRPEGNNMGPGSGPGGNMGARGPPGNFPPMMAPGGRGGGRRGGGGGSPRQAPPRPGLPPPRPDSGTFYKYMGRPTAGGAAFLVFAPLEPRGAVLLVLSLLFGKTKLSAYEKGHTHTL